MRLLQWPCEEDSTQKSVLSGHRWGQLRHRSRYSFKKIKSYLGRVTEANRCQESSEVGRKNRSFMH